MRRVALALLVGGLNVAVLCLSPAVTTAAAASPVVLSPGLVVADGLRVSSPGRLGSDTDVRLTLPNVETAEYAVTDPQFSPDGRRLLVTYEGVHYVIDWVGRRVSDPVGADSEYVSEETVWWADDDQLYVSRFAEGRGFELWLETVEGTIRERVLTSEVWVGGPLATTDKGAVLYYTLATSNGYGIVRHDLSTGTNEVIVPPAIGDLDDLAASPDGSELAFSRNGALWLVGTDGTELRKAAQDYVAQVAWSSNGAHVAYSKLSGGHVQVLEVGTGLTQGSGMYSTGTGIAWQPLPDCTITGTDQNETLLGTPGDDVICGGGGDDTVHSSGGDDVVLGEDGFDTIDASASADAIDIDLSSFWAAGQGHMELLSIENITGSDQADVLRGDFENNALAGGPGDDRIVPDRYSTDAVLGGLGSDTLDLSGNQSGPGGFIVDLEAGTLNHDGIVSGIEHVGGGYNDHIAGDDRPNVLQSSGIDSLIEGRGGDDTLTTDGFFDYRGASGGVRVDVIAGTASGADGNDVLVGGRGAFGSVHADTLVGSLADSFEAGSGDDLIVLRGDATDAVGGIDGGEGVDAVDLATMPAKTRVDLSIQDPYISVDGLGGPSVFNVEAFVLTAFEDSFVGGIEGVSVAGGGGADHIIGSGRSDTIRGDGGADSLYAGSGNDVVSAGPGNDLLVGSFGRDTLVGDHGSDVVKSRDGNRDSVDGGTGPDTCRSDRVDVVRSCPTARDHSP